MERKLIKTEDGSHTLFVPELDEHYHSIHGAIQESNHVFIEAGLSKIEKKKIVIFEVGFGTGLNAIMTFLWAKEHQVSIDYYSIEKYPVSPEEVLKLNYASLLDETTLPIFEKMHNANWGSSQEITSSFKLCKLHEDMKSVNFKDLPLFNLIYFDAFAPDVQPTLWSVEIFQKLYQHSDENSVLTTYCAKGVVRRTMLSCGFTVERIPGPPGKREMLRAKRLS